MDLVRSTHPIDETFDAAFSALFDRASDFDGYGYVGGDTRDAERLAMRVRSEWVADGAAALSKEERRAALFTECRMLRFSGYPPSQRLFSYLLSLEASIDGAIANPWLSLVGTDPPWTVPADRPQVHANNRFSNPTHQLILNLPPEPWVGRLDAPVVVLNLNPGVAEGDETSPLLPKLRDAAFANLAQEPVQWPLYHLDPAFASHPGGRWWRRCLRTWINTVGDQAVARHVVGLEFHGYHSKSSGPLPVTLPSQDFVFHRLTAALTNGAVVVGLRGKRLWSTAVPELADRPNVWWASNPRAPSVSELNIGARAWEEAVRTIRIADAT